MHTTQRPILFAALLGSILACSSQAYETNAPSTKLEIFEATTGSVIIKGIAEMGSIAANAANVAVRCKESIDVTTGRREYGMAISIKEGERDEEVTVIDYDELDTLLAGLDYIARADYSVTELPSFSVGYRTRGGLRIATYSSRRNPGTIQAALQLNRTEKTRVLLAADQLAQLRNLVQQVKTKLDQMRANHA